MIYEVRDYVAVPGRLPALISMFNEVSRPLMSKHGLDLVSVGMNWLGEDAFNGISYTMRFTDVAALDAAWSAYLSDPDWTAAEAARTADGPIVAKITRRVLDATPFESLS